MPSARLLPLAFALLLAPALLPPAVRGARAEDAEKATHADLAATPQTSYEARQGDVFVRQYQLGCLSQLTYLVGSQGKAVVIDPQRDVEHYVRDAKALGYEITTVVLTHTNADFVAGHTELSRRVGAKVWISAESGSAFPHEGLKDGTKIPLGAATLEALATPGHTLDSMTILVHVPGVTPDPVWAFTGDTLFVGGIGRPDLVGGDVGPVRLAGLAFESVRRLKALPDGTIVLPAHGAGSLCGAHLSPETTSTIGREKAGNPYLVPQSRTAFVARMVTGLPVAPAYFKHNVRINREGPPVVDATDELPKALSPAEVKARVDGGAWVVDLRDAKVYAEAHVPGAVNVAVRGRLDTWTGIVVPFEAEMILVGSDAEVKEAAFRYRRIGLDRIAGRLDGGVAAWAAAGLPVRRTELLSPKELSARIAAGTEPMLVDVRTPAEHAEVAIDGTANVSITDAHALAGLLDKAAPTLFVCNSAYRSSMAVGLAERLGFEKVGSLDGGVDAWITAGLPTVGTASTCGPTGCVVASASSAPSAPAALLLPEWIEPRTLADALLDRAGAYVVLDVRPAWQFAEWSVPGSVHVAPEAVLERVRALPVGARVVLVDRDGTFAPSVAAAVLARLNDASRTIRVLAGGLARFHREIESGSVGGAGGGVPAGSATPPKSGAPVPAAPAAPAAPEAPAPAPKKRPAGC